MTDLLSNFVPLVPLVIAQIAPAESTRGEILTVLLGIAALAVIANTLAELWRNLTGKLKEQPPPGQTYIRILDCKETHAEINARFLRIEERADERSDALRKEIKTDIGGVHEKINAVISAVGELKGEIKRGLK